MKSILSFFVFLVPIFIYSQSKSISGTLRNKQLQPVESALVLLKSLDDIVLGYTYSNEKGTYYLEFESNGHLIALLEVSSLGYATLVKEIEILSSNQTINITLEEELESLKEVVVEANQKIKIDADTTFIRVSQYTTKTEQTVEDILKRLPGIEVLPDGSIKAHGKPIENLLVEGENILDKNYKILSKNLDANTLEEVQILDNYEENPIFKSLSTSEKVAINLKLKSEFRNIWFGNVSGGYGLENRYQGALTLGLLRKRIKLLEFSNVNNTGDKAVNLLSNDDIVLDLSQIFQPVEKKPFTVTTIDDQENNVLNSRSIFNTSMLHSLGLSSKWSEKFHVRGSVNVISDETEQAYQALTEYNTEETFTSFAENSDYLNKNRVGSTEFELTLIPNEKNYVNNTVKFNRNPQKTFNEILLGDTEVFQQNKALSETFYNHLEHTYQLAENTVLYNYLYLGYGQAKEHTQMEYPLLNDFLETQSNEPIFQDFRDSFLYYGLQSTIIVRQRKWENQLKWQAHIESEHIESRLFDEDQSVIEGFRNNIDIDNNFITISNAFKYKLKRDDYLRAGISLTQNWFNEDDYLLKNTSLTYRVKFKNIGNIRIGYNYKEDLPRAQLLLFDFALNSYQGFSRGATEITKLKSSIFSFNYSLYNDIKGFSINSSLLHSITHDGYAANTFSDNNFVFNDLLPFSGGSNSLANIGFTNYFRKWKVATKWSTDQGIIQTPLSVSGMGVRNLTNYSGNYALSVSSYFSKWFNFSGGISHKFTSSKIGVERNSFTSQNIFLNLDLNFSETLKATVKNELFFLENESYHFLNTTVTYEPKKSKWAISLYLNNLLNEEDYLIQQINLFTSYEKRLRLVPAYALLNLKYRL